jgi:hypothetical protein
MKEYFNFHSFIKSGTSLKIKIDEAQNRILDYFIKKQGKVDVSETKKIIEQIRTLNELKENLIQNLHSIEHFFFIEDEEDLLSLKETYLKISPNKIQPYISNIIKIIDENERVTFTYLRTGLYYRIKDNISKHEFDLNKKYKSLSNWEVHFYQAIIFLRCKGFIVYDDSTSSWKFGLRAIQIIGKDDSDSREEIHNITSLDAEQEFDPEEVSQIEEIFDNKSFCEIKNMILSNMRKDKLIDDISFKDCILMIVDDLTNLDGEQIQNFNDILLDEKYSIKTYEQEDISEIKVIELFNVYSVFIGVDISGIENFYFFTS